MHVAHHVLERCQLLLELQRAVHHLTQCALARVVRLGLPALRIGLPGGLLTQRPLPRGNVLINCGQEGGGDPASLDPGGVT